MFTKKSKTMENIPPTANAFLQHIKRTVYQAVPLVADERAVDVLCVTVRYTGAGMHALILDHHLLFSSRQVAEPRHALPIAFVGFERGVVPMRLDNVSQLWLR